MKTGIFSGLLPIIIGLASIARGQSTISTTNRYIYSANAGWIDLRTSPTDGVQVSESYLAGKAYAANFGWIDFGDGTPSNGFSYANNSTTDFGINVASDGSLTGFSYSANVGWINFEQLFGFPLVNFLTGKFTGHIYSANIGWISLDTAVTDLLTSTIAYPDTDGDGIADAWEQKRFGNLTVANGVSNFDGDELSDRAEYEADTLPKDAASRLRIVSQTYNPGFTQNTLQFTSAPSRLYRIETSANLNGIWTNSTFGTFPPDGGLTTTRTLNFTASSSKFFRAVAVRPLQ